MWIKINGNGWKIRLYLVVPMNGLNLDIEMSKDTRRTLRTETGNSSKSPDWLKNQLDTENIDNPS